MKRRAWRGALTLVVLGIALTALALTAGSERHATTAHELGIERDAPQQQDAERTRERTRAAQVVAPATLGPHVGTGTFQGESPVVADLPVVQAPIVTQIHARDSENLGAASGSASNAKDPVVQKKKGTGSISAPGSYCLTSLAMLPKMRRTLRKLGCKPSGAALIVAPSIQYAHSDDGTWISAFGNTSASSFDLMPLM